MTAAPPIAHVALMFSENGSVPSRSFESLAAADAALARAFAIEPPPKGGGYHKTSFELVWTDGQRHEGRVDVTEDSVRTAPAAGGILREHLAHVGRWMRDKGATSQLWTPAEAEKRRAWGVELLRRLEAEPPLGAPRNAGMPYLARVEILWSTLPALAARAYRSLDDAEAAIETASRALRNLTAPDRDQVLFRVVWADGFSHDEGVVFLRGEVPPTVLRARLHAVAVWQRDVFGTSKKLTEEDRAQRRAWGNDLIARLAAATSSSSTRNLHEIPEDQLLPLGTIGEGLAVTLFPDPLAAAAELEAHFAAIRPPVKVWMGHGRTVPKTTNEDVTYAANRLSLSLAHDMAQLRALTGRAHGAIWDRWTKTIEHVRRHLGTDPDATYRDNPQFWSTQVQRLAREIETALHGDVPRNSVAGERTQYRVTSRRPDGSLIRTHHTARDDFDAKQRAAFYLGYEPQIVAIDAQYTDGVWSPATMIDGSRRSIRPSGATPPS